MVRIYQVVKKQRIALARGIIREKKVVLLDEITSNLDKDNAEKIEELLLTNPELTVILITHRLDSNSEQRIYRYITIIIS